MFIVKNNDDFNLKINDNLNLKIILKSQRKRLYNVSHVYVWFDLVLSDMNTISERDSDIITQES